MCSRAIAHLNHRATHLVQTNPHPEKLLWQISPFIDPPVHGDKALHGGLVSDVRVMQAGVQHDDGERQHIAGV